MRPRVDLEFRIFLNVFSSGAVAAYVFYALSQAVTPAPQVEIVRNIIPDPQYFATGYA